MVSVVFFVCSSGFYWLASNLRGLGSQIMYSKNQIDFLILFSYTLRDSQATLLAILFSGKGIFTFIVSV